MRDMLLVVAGLCGVYAEFIWPCKVIPGAAGGVVFMVGLAGMLKGRVDVQAAMLLGVPFAVLTIALLAIAWRARRNKTTA
jgi:membrane protein implicated in regulation of membrane protease activity